MAPAAELEAVLVEEAARLDELLPLLDAERRALERAEAGTVQALAARQEALAAELERLEQRRLGLVQALAASCGVRPEALPASALSRLVPDRARFEAATRRLRAALGRLGPLLATNALLSARLLHHTRGLLGALLALA
jgi:flagellar biosynthesis/type III secretory pathway chaperone